MSALESNTGNEQLQQLSAQELVDKILEDQWFSEDTERGEYEALLQKLKEEKQGVIDISHEAEHALVAQLIGDLFEGVTMPIFPMYSEHNGETYYDGTLDSGENILVNKKGEYYINGDFSSEKLKLTTLGSSEKLINQGSRHATPVISYGDPGYKPEPLPVRPTSSNLHGNMNMIQDELYPGVAPAPETAPVPELKPNKNGADFTPLPKQKPIRNTVQETVSNTNLALKNFVNILRDNQAILAQEYGKNTLMLSDLIARAKDYISRGTPNILPRKGVKYTNTQKADSIALQGLISLAAKQSSADKMGDLDAFFGSKSGIAMGETIGESVSNPSARQIQKLLKLVEGFSDNTEIFTLNKKLEAPNELSGDLGDWIPENYPKTGKNSCGKAVGNALINKGFKGLPRSGRHGYKFEQFLDDMPTQFEKVAVANPWEVKAGGICVYSEGAERGSPARKKYGHVEIRGADSEFYSYYGSPNPGGSSRTDFKNKEQYAKDTGFIGYAYYPISKIA